MKVKKTLIKIKNQTNGQWEEYFGLQGKSAYEIAIKYGFQGTEEEWNAHIATKEDVNSIKLECSQLERPIIVSNVSEMTDPTKQYVLNGYLYQYEKRIQIIPAGKFPNFTNQIPISTDVDGSIFNGVGYKANVGLLQTDGSEWAGGFNGRYITGFIPIGTGTGLTAMGEQVIHLDGIATASQSAYISIFMYTEDKTYIHYRTNGQMGTAINTSSPVMVYTKDESGNMKTIDISAYTYHMYNQGKGKCAYVRLEVKDVINSDVAVTVNEEISYTIRDKEEEIVTYSWENTGYAYNPADYEDRIIELEKTNEELKKSVVDMENYII